MKNTASKIVILGAAESGVGAALLAHKIGWDVIVSDAGKIKEVYKKALQEQGIAFEENGHTESKILAAECVIKSPGIPNKAAIVQKIHAAGIELISEIEFGYRNKGESKIIAITGSNGKSTTTKMIYHTMQLAGLDVSMVGNIGNSFAKQIAEKPTEWYVIEVSSFQLDDIISFRPNVALILNISPDHLDRYEYKIENYIKAKFKITQNQEANDIFITNKDDTSISNYLANNIIKARTIYFTMSEQTNQNSEGAFIENEQLNINYDGERTTMSIHDLSVQGKHNQFNSMAAGISARTAGIRSAKIRESFTSFEGIAHRLEFVASVRGVDFINDSKATNVNSVWFALESMKKPTVLILGGQDKGNDYNEIKELVIEKVKAIVCLGVNNQNIHEFFESIVPTIIDTQNAKDAVLAAYSLAEKNDVVLLAPACASFDVFENYEDRGDQFKAAVRNL
ncbi:MAG: UDP-N-acetylmuramoyl-L-alanine--D-glutamate ligase [Chitinophagaceae bacterium]|nr:UDP-N-acetylmuramoyl-L-alanine--D-glutamate ligase [Chitinophagaceae bacterium]